MNGYERVKAFVNGGEFDRPPFMPLIIEWVARQKGIPYPDFVYKPEVRAQAYLDICGPVRSYESDHLSAFHIKAIIIQKISEKSPPGRISGSRLLRSSTTRRISTGLKSLR